MILELCRFGSSWWLIVGPGPDGFGSWVCASAVLLPSLKVGPPLPIDGRWLQAKNQPQARPLPDGGRKTAPVQQQLRSLDYNSRRSQR